MNDEIPPDNKSVKKGLRDRLASPFNRRREKGVPADIPEPPDMEEEPEDSAVTESSPVRIVDKIKHLAHRRKSTDPVSESVTVADNETPPDSDVIVETESVPSHFSEAVSRYRPAIERVVLNGLIDVAESKLRDEIFLMSLFNRACDIILAPLPGAVRLVIPREMLLKWLMQNREPLLLMLHEYKAVQSGKVQQDAQSIPQPATELPVCLTPPDTSPPQDK
ncbi:hypothetical protein [Citrobacter amalonaticus]|uniref:Uncharacterized protein n=1 Tax=Citrobacter amalonaticus TaxID=35703 RepID=A0A8I0T1P6_CITAM|nr:hypothetical protein [Citrobacter amalonaticus]MBE0131173.1 hypothetical protein [Citrobacter amalonaticus]